ncbi:hypothetical protein [Pseudarthrobacter niigatensis]|uniref:Uncharacterized protein n=1 Tax=Pseudarthrobacter niigatensis TaxID=369935 RepID=A0AAJ1WEM2_9MICC|nr:hypothetical protein [Pseudarthrobacter niigatensis]MDQ0147464.1 hypothetical protein [Pseudarthrobacter niigatensis]MDQ0267396.1 hypothetical protein [Pseudarthrobacter niigatensis]
MTHHKGPAADGHSGQESWRDSVPEATATDLENLLGTGVSAAQEQLQRAGGFLPFALTVQNDGEVRLVAVSPADGGEGSDGEFDADAMIHDLQALLRQNRGDFRAAAVVCDILLVEEDSDAIHVAAEHQDGSLFAAVLPYSANATTQSWEYGELGADASEPVIWVD